MNSLVGTWGMQGRPLGSREDSITGRTTSPWLHGTQQDMEMDYADTPIKIREIIGYNPKSRAFSSFVYSNMAPDPWPYEWDVQGDDVTISIRSGQMDATFRGKFAPGGNSFSGARFRA